MWGIFVAACRANPSFPISAKYHFVVGTSWRLDIQVIRLTGYRQEIPHFWRNVWLVFVGLATFNSKNMMEGKGKEKNKAKVNFTPKFHFLLHLSLKTKQRVLLQRDADTEKLWTKVSGTVSMYEANFQSQQDLYFSQRNVKEHRRWKSGRKIILANLKLSIRGVFLRSPLKKFQVRCNASSWLGMCKILYWFQLQTSRNESSI